jgi:hypothetical protein
LHGDLHLWVFLAWRSSSPSLLGTEVFVSRTSLR